MTLSHLPLPSLVWYSRTGMAPAAWVTLSLRCSEWMAGTLESLAKLFIIPLEAEFTLAVHQFRSSHIFSHKDMLHKSFGQSFFLIECNWKIPPDDLKSQKIMMRVGWKMRTLSASNFCVKRCSQSMCCICVVSSASLQSWLNQGRAEENCWWISSDVRWEAGLWVCVCVCVC